MSLEQVHRGYNLIQIFVLPTVLWKETGARNDVSGKGSLGFVSQGGSSPQTVLVSTVEKTTCDFSLSS